MERKQKKEILTPVTRHCEKHWKKNQEMNVTTRENKWRGSSCGRDDFFFFERGGFRVCVGRPAVRV